jgi:hypothetical protein
MFLWLALILPVALGEIAIAKNVRPPAAAEQTQIVCTRSGCIPLPAGCYTKSDEAFGNPTGYESAVCPQGKTPQK